MWGMLANVIGCALGRWGFFYLEDYMCELEANLMCARCRSFFFFLDFFLEDYMWLDVRWVDEKGRLSRAESSLGGEAFQLRAKELLWDIGLIFVTTIICECTKLMYLPNFLNIQHLYCEQLRAKELLLDIALIFESQKFTYLSIFKGRFPYFGLQMNV